MIVIVVAFYTLVALVATSAVIYLFLMTKKET